MCKSTAIVVALAAIALFSLALIQSAEARGYRPLCGYPEYGYLPPYFFGGSHTPRVNFAAVAVSPVEETPVRLCPAPGRPNRTSEAAVP